MSQYTYIVRQASVKDIGRLNEIILNGDPHWPGLTSAEQIISIQHDWKNNWLNVWWRVRSWLDGRDPNET